MRIDESGSGTEVAATVGEIIEVLLAENPTTGHRWHVASDGSPVCRLRAATFDAPAGPPGAPGRRRFELEVVSAGNALLALEYRRLGSAPARRFSLRIAAR